MGGELLHAAPLQPCAEAPSGQYPPCSTGMGHPLGMAPCAEAPHPLSFIRSVGLFLSELCQYISCQLLQTTWPRVFIARHNIN